MAIKEALREPLEEALRRFELARGDVLNAPDPEFGVYALLEDLNDIHKWLAKADAALARHAPRAV